MAAMATPATIEQYLKIDIASSGETVSSCSCRLGCARDSVRCHVHTHLSIFAIPSTLCFFLMLATYTRTEHFSSLVNWFGEGNTSLLFASISLFYFPLLQYLTKIRGFDRNGLALKAGSAAIFMIVDLVMHLVYCEIGDALPVVFLAGCVVNLGDFVGVGDVEYQCQTTVFIALMIANQHWGLSYLVLGIAFFYLNLRIWVY